MRATIKLLSLLIGTVLVLLALGLWPFHAPANEVSWTTYTPGLYFGDYGTVISAAPFGMATKGHDGCSVEIWLKPRHANDSGTLLAFYDPESPQHFNMLEYGHSLILRREDSSSPIVHKAAKFTIPNVFPNGRLIFLNVTAGPAGTAVYVNGLLAAKSSTFFISPKEFTGKLVVANSPVRNDSWTGLLRGLALFNTELSAAEVRHHYGAWVQNGRPDTNPGEEPIAVYRFREAGGRIAHSAVMPAIDLRVPEHYTVLRQVFLESPGKEFRRTHDYWLRVGKNVIGFVPLGFFCFAYLAARQIKRALYGQFSWERS